MAVQGPSLSQPITDGVRWGYMDSAGLRKARAMSQLAPGKSHICLLGSHLNVIPVQSPSQLAPPHHFDPEQRLSRRGMGRGWGQDGSKC